MPNVPSSGWHVAVTHPVTGRTITPQVLSRPQFLPSLNSLPEIRIPVAQSASWLDDGFDDNPTLDVWLDGEKQPIDELRRVEDEQGQTILVGVGGVELRQRVEAEYTSEERHVAARGLVTGETSYAEDVDTPTFTTLQDQPQQSVTTTAEFDANTIVGDTDPVDTSGGEVTIYQTCWPAEGEDHDTSSGVSIFSAADYSGDSPTDGRGVAATFDANGDSASWDFTTDYKIPAGEFGFYLRTVHRIVDQIPDFELFFDGNSLGTGSISVTPLGWLDVINGGPRFNDPAPIPAGSHTIKLEAVGSFGTDEYDIDVVAPTDLLTRYDWISQPSDAYTFYNTVTTASDNNNYLDGPGTHPDIFYVEGDDATTAFRYTEATANITIDNTSDDQSLQLSADRGMSWEPTNGDENNTSSVTVDYSGNPTATARLRIGLSSFSPSGTRNQTPRENYDSQTVTDWEILADVTEQQLLIDQTFDGSLVSILNDISGSTQDYIWSYNLDSSGNPQVSWTQPGQRVAASDPDFSDITIEKDTDTWPKITIKGSNKKVSGKTFTAKSAFQDLTPNNENIVPNSESIYDPNDGTQFERNSDYEMDYRNGEIKTLSGSNMTNGTDYQADYSQEVRGTYTDSNAPANPDERVESVPAVTSASAAEQVAWSLVQDFKDPRWAGDAVIPQTDAQFDPLDALPLASLDLPSAATPLEISGSPEQTPEGLRFRLGSDTELSQALSAIGGQLRSVSKRV